jgi:hypothetical protein
VAHFLSPHLQLFVVENGMDPKDQYVYITLLVKNKFLEFCAIMLQISVQSVVVFGIGWLPLSTMVISIGRTIG